MAVEIYFELEGVKGESSTKGFENQMEVQTFTCAVDNPSSVAFGGGSGWGKANFSSMALSRQIDLAKCKLWGAVAKGTHFPSATLTVREAGGDTPLSFYVLEFKQVFCDSIYWGGTTAEGKPDEGISFTYETIKLRYTAQDGSGGAGDHDEFGWSLKQNVEI